MPELRDLPLPSRESAAPVPVAEPDRPVPTLDDVPALLERMRQINALVLARRLDVAAEDRARFAWLNAHRDAGITRLLDRALIQNRLALPWARGGGAYFSFTERVHDYNRRPQVSLQSGRLDSSFYGASEEYWIDLGGLDLAAVDRATPPALDQITALEWSVAWRALDDDARTSGRPMRDMLRREITAAYEEGRFVFAAVEEASRPERGVSAPALAGHTYLLRAISRDEHDIVVAVHVVRAGADECTLAWRILESWPVESPRDVQVPPMVADDLPPAPESLRELENSQLMAELERLREQTHALLFERFSPEIEARFGALREEPNAGLTRLQSYQGGWSELTRDGCDAGLVSFSGHDGAAHLDDLCFQGLSNRSFNVPGNRGAVLDLGALALDAVATPRDIARVSETARFLLERELSVVLPDELAAASEPDRLQQSRQLYAGAWAELQRELRPMLGDSRTGVVAGHTYLVRSIHFGERDQLTAVHVAGLDAQGVVIAWRTVREFAIAKPR